MDIKKTVTQYYAEWVADKGASWTECMTKALEDQAATHAHELRAYEATVANLVEALRGVIRVADRDTVEFDAAKAAIFNAMRE
jgi:outer membrane murein-binding lipoprotein Lpp